MKFKRLFLPSIVLGGAALLIGPPLTSEGYSLIGDDLPLAQRDFRIHNNFSKAMTNDNLTPDDNFPGHQGAVMAIWKACMEWSSEVHGSGNGDPHQPGSLGSGGANFDPSFQGEASSVGSSSNNIHSQISGGSGGVLAYCEGSAFSGGAWRIRYYENWDWEDGPAPPSIGDMDLQGVGCHEYGHALGLGHSNVAGSTMWPSAGGTAVGGRSIGTDDIAGTKAIYGVKSGSKPRITSIDIIGNTLILNGSSFSGSGNEVWFTNANTTSAGSNPFVKLTNVSSTGGGTQISITIPGNGGPGDVMVKKTGSGHSSLSNAWPFDPDGLPDPPMITGLSPASIPVVFVSDQLITITGNGLDTLTAVFFEGNPVPYTTYASGAASITLSSVTGIGPKDITVETFFGSDTSQLNVVACDPPVLVNENPVTFAGVPATLTIGALPTATILLAGSPSQLPSVLPGIISADIGAGFTTLTLVGILTAPASGTVSLTLPTAGLPPLSAIYFQAAVLDTAGTLPMPVSNVSQLVII